MRLMRALTPDEIELIAALPESRAEAEDRMIWYLDAPLDYQARLVTLGYYLMAGLVMIGAAKRVVFGGVRYTDTWSTPAGRQAASDQTDEEISMEPKKRGRPPLTQAEIKAKLDFAARLILARDDEHISQRGLARLCGVETHIVTSLEYATGDWTGEKAAPVRAWLAGVEG